jgi:DNA-binding NarL/FixJ family response regulator
MKVEGDLMSKPCVRLLLVDNHQIVRIGLATLFRTVPHFLVIGEAGTVAEAVAQARQCAPDVVLMDVRLPDGSVALRPVDKSAPSNQRPGCSC